MPYSTFSFTHEQILMRDKVPNTDFWACSKVAGMT